MIIILIINAKIYTMGPLGILENGFVYIKGKKIEQVGSMKELDISDSELIDLKGKWVYPGFIDAHTHLGMCEDGLTFEGDDLNEAMDPITPQLRAIDAINPMDRCFKEAIDAGVTTVVTGPGSANPISGQSVAIKTYGKRIDDMILKDPVAIKFALGENPKVTYNDKNQSPCTRMATAALIREQLVKARRYFEDKIKHECDEEEDEPEFDAKCEALIPLLKCEIPAHFHAHRADDIFTAIRIAKEFNIKYVIIHGTEGHIIAEELKREEAFILSGPFLCDRSKPELCNLTPQTPGVLNKHEVKSAIITDHPVIPIQYLPVCAALAIREGMNPYESLKNITINAAEICGIEKNVGSIEKGKDADILIFDGDALDFTSKPLMVFCNGKKVK